MLINRQVFPQLLYYAAPLDRRRAGRMGVVASLLLAHAAMLCWSAAQHSPTVDEVAWLCAGISHWQLGRFELGRVNPPLVRMLATLPVMAEVPQLSWEGYSGKVGSRSEFQVGSAVFKQYGERVLHWCIVARWSCVPLSVLGAVITTALT